MRCPRLVGLVGAVALGCSLMAASPAVASTGTSDDSSVVVLEEFRAGLSDRIASGVDGAEAELALFDQLTDAQRDELTSILVSDGAVLTQPTEESTVTVETPTEVVSTDGDLTWTEETGVTGVAARAASRGVWHESTVAFAGITLNKVKVSGNYEYSGGKATKVLGYSCVVLEALGPTQQVTSKKNTAYISGGKAYFKCKVTSRWGVPTPWGQISWSQRESIQFVRGGAAGYETGGWA